MGVVFTNNASSTLAAGITAAQTTLAVGAAEAALFPAPAAGDWFPVTVVEGTNLEVMRCTARSGVTLTVTRAQEGTTGKVFGAGALVDHRLTRAALQAFLQDPPSDGAFYGRVNAAWAAGVTKVTYDTDQAAQNAAINTKLADAPSNANLYARKGAAWVAFPSITIADAAPSSVLPGHLWWESDSGNMFIWYVDANSSQWVQVNAAVGAAGVMIERVVTVTEVYNKPAGLQYLEVEGIGPGGAGGGAVLTAAGQSSAASAGSAGAWGKRLFSASELPASLTITVAPPGAPVLGGNGGAGGTSSFGSTFNCTLAGGGGGTRTAAVAVHTRCDSAVGGVPGAGWTVSNQGQTGEPGYAAWSGNVALATRAKGGETLYGVSYASIVVGAAAGADALGFGSGGTGSANSASTAAKLGGAGAPSMFILREYF